MNSINLLKILERTQDPKKFEPRYLIDNGIWPVYYGVIRKQADRFKKQREVILNGKKLPTSGLNVPVNRKAMRVRRANALPGSASYINTIWVTGFRNYYFREFAYTFKHRGHEHVAQKMEKFKHFLGADVTQFDNSVPSFFLDTFLKEMENKLPKHVVRVLRLTLGAPTICSNPFPIGYPGEFDQLLDPLSTTSYELNKGLASGHVLTPDLGKLFMSADYLIAADKCGLIDATKEAEVIAFLQGRLDIGLLNQGDDSVLMAKEKGVCEKWLDALVYFRVDIEKPIVFLGGIFGKEEGKIVGYPKLMSFFDKYLVPEHPIGGRGKQGRPYPVTGWRERKLYYSAHPLFQEIYLNFDAIVKANFGTGIDPLILSFSEPFKNTPTYSWADEEFLRNPDSIHYKLDINEISEHLRKQHFFVVSKRVVIEILNLLGVEYERDF